MKTMKALEIETKALIACTHQEGDNDIHGKAIWRTENGEAYELSYARMAKKHFFNRYPAYDK